MTDISTTTTTAATFTTNRAPRQDYRASRQWMTRPEDERHVSLHAMYDRLQDVKEHSKVGIFANREVTAVPDPKDPEHKGLRLAGPRGGLLDISNWSFGQLAKLGGAPAGYLRQLPAPLAADCLNYGLKVERAPEEVGLLMTRTESDPMPILRAATGPAYGRIWNADVVKRLIDAFGDGITGDFRVPGEFGKGVEVTKANTTLYASDRDMFVFLADEKNRIEVPNRRDGKPGSLAKGFYVWNSEVGDTTFGLGVFLFDFVCCNRIVWGQQDYQELKIVHRKTAPDRFLEEAAPLLLTFAQQGVTSADEAKIRAAIGRKVDAVDEFLRNRAGLSSTRAAAVMGAFEADEHRPMESLWDVATGLTAYARAVPYQDQRVELERLGGKIIDMAV